ncbi:MAG: hypothetical protein CMJ81_18245 [Planctomycetaceae bacterium]|nr:hypothetical protein [Planctomycetaceae bacterium]
MTRSGSIVIRGLFLLLLVASSGLTFAQEKNDSPVFDEVAIEFFETQVRPVLVKRCYACHSSDAQEIKGGLRLDSRAAALQGGETGPAIVPGNLSESLLIDTVNYGATYQMPPKSKLPVAEIAALTNWVKRGAPWPAGTVVSRISREKFDLNARKGAHWCWQDVQEHEPPAVGKPNWPSYELDYFVLARMEASGLSPAPPTDKRTLIRRAFFDVIGLPPLPEQVHAFVNDNSSEAFEKVVDELLESPHFGERWARHWMDSFRYAEGYGHEFDYPIPYVFRYRDYLIRALNADVPYDQFVIEHVAGDLLEEPRRHPVEGYNESVIGPGFWWLGEATHAPVDVRDDEARRIDNQIDVMTKTFLGLTVACARCHEHKFDAITMEDYYALTGFLQSSRRHEAALDPGDRIESLSAQLVSEKRKVDGMVPQVVLTTNDLSGDLFADYLLASREVETGTPAEVVAGHFDLETERLSRWVDAMKQSDVKPSSHPMHVWAALAQSGEDVVAANCDEHRDRMVEESKNVKETNEMNPLISDFDNGYDGWFTTGEAFGANPTRKQQWDRRASELILDTPGVADSGAVSNRLQGVLRSPTFTLTHPNIFYRIRGKGAQVQLILDGYFMHEFNELLFGGFRFDVNDGEDFAWQRQAADIGRYLGHQAYIEIIDQGDGFVAIDEIRLSNGTVPPTPPSDLAMEVLENEGLDSLEALAAAYGRVWDRVVQAWQVGSLNASDQELIDWTLRRRLINVASGDQLIFATAQRRMQELEKDIPDPVRILSMVDGTGENERVFVRGNHRTLGEETPRQLLTALVGRKPDVKKGSGRLDLAEDIVDPANPLTARVMVNRIWHHLFGRGIVGSVDNFGVLGQRPSHPKLLDFLAIQFVNNGWSVKHMIRRILLSSTYQMSSVPNAAVEKIDPDNVLLHRMRIRRLQGEVIRDSILQISGRLDHTLFGRSVPIHMTEFMQGRGRPSEKGALDGDGRRSIYLEVRRNFLSPMMLAFDTPIPFNSVGRRNISNVPAQALIMMNDPLVIEQARVWARRLLSDKDLSVEQRMENMYLAAFASPPRKTELSEGKNFLRQQGKALGLAPEAYKTDERVWADLCHVMMNVKKFIFIH